MKHSNLKQKLTAMIIACFAAIAPMSAQVPQTCPLPAASQFYDLDGTGSKGFIKQYSDEGIPLGLYPFKPAADNKFIREEMIFSGNSNKISIDDLNRDGKPDIGIIGYADGWTGDVADQVLVSQPDGSYQTRSGLLLPNNDLNMDGRIDLVECNYNTSSGTGLYLHAQQANGSFTRSFMQRMSQTEYDASQNQEEYEAYLQAVQAGYRPPKPRFSGVCLEGGCGNAVIAPDIKQPSEILDMNGDGNPDLVFAETGIVLFSTENAGRFVQTALGNNVKARDLNNDGFTDYVIWDNAAQALKTYIYRGENSYETNVLMEDVPADKTIHCYDFDRDGDVDILATFSYPLNGSYNFILLAKNDGNGNFDIGFDMPAGQLLFAGCRDINGDGYYDLLALDVSGMPQGWYQSDILMPVKVMYGQAGGSFGAAETLYTANDIEHNGVGQYSDFPTMSLNIEDLDNDGKMEIWYSGQYSSDDYFHTMATATVNTAPAAPAAPSVTFNAATGRLDINWTAATDAQSSACDLTYEVRIGTAPGKSDILFAHANANGTRRNFADGNAGNNLSKVMDASTWMPGTYYIAVQAIDPQHAGSAWSTEAVFENTVLSSKFTTDKNSLAFCDTLKVYYNSMPEGYTLHWELNGATQLPSSVAGELHLKWATAGNKTISLQIEAPEGTRGEKTEMPITVLANKIEGTVVDETTRIMKSDLYEKGWFADWNRDGKQDVLLGGYDNKGLFTNDGAGNFGRLANPYLLTFAPEAGKWIDWDRDGAVDLLYRENNAYGWIRNTSNAMGFSNKNALTFTGIDYYGYLPGAIQNMQFSDLDNDGDLEPVRPGTTYYQTLPTFVQNDGSGNFSPGFTIPDGQDVLSGYKSGIADWNKDGFLDFYSFSITTGPYEITGIQLLENKGNYSFEYKKIPFETPIPTTSSLVTQVPVADMDNDGYLDIIYVENSQRIQILRNENNERFVLGDEIVAEDVNVSFLNRISGSGWSSELATIAINGDWDNNGYLDILVDVKVNNQDNVVYIIYNDGNGNYRQGLFSDMRGNGFILDNTRQNIVTDTDGDGVPNISLGRGESVGYNEQTGYPVGYYFYDKNVTSATNTAPNAPTGIIATQTDTTLVIEWDAAQDDKTPAAQMKYNLSVKKKGETGANAYIISPLNDGNAAMAALPSPKGGLELGSGTEAPFSKYYLYPTATRFEIPLSAIPAGEVEISVQAIDLWDAVSPFSEVFTKKVEATASFKIPATACFDTPTEIVYTGAQGGTPEWDFDGGQVVSGTGFGPYQVAWNSEGIKTITLTNGANTATAQIKVMPGFTAEFTLPDNVFFNQEVEIGLPAVPQGSTFSWDLSNRVGNFIDNDVTARPGDSKGSIRIYGGSYIYRELTLWVTSPNGCAEGYTKGFNVVEPITPPVISLVYPEGNKNVVAWETSNLPAEAAQVVIYKEGSALNNFIEIGRVNAGEGAFTDPSSNNTVRSDRYAISAVTASGVETAKSGIHKTMHLTINRGVQEGTWNLIWNKYEGREIDTYRILQGATPDNLTNVLDEISGANTSFTQFHNPDAPYYVVEYIPAPQTRSAGLRAAEAPVSGRTNVVNSNNAATIVYASSLNILTLGNNDVLSEEQPSLYLYTEIFPSNATYQNIAWSIVSGSEYATVDNSGNLQATGNTQAGTVTVKATAVDGSAIFATRTFTVQAFPDATIPVTSVQLNTPDEYLRVGDQLPLFATVYPLNATNQNISWSSSEPGIASVDNSGTVTALTAGTAIITVTTEDGGYFDECKVAISETVGIENIANNNAISIYPNPVKDILFISTDTEIKQLIVTNTLGAVVLKITNAGNREINVSSLPHGVYFVTLETAEGIVTKKFIKE
ncbi:MAG: FG-GAP-like repeat-containing protein [Prevotellaceae bacterium]|jgi:hypothetical protein|nr:FG-GAP-like repeat-containing protein [Prevotellaceae bacterium]